VRCERVFTVTPTALYTKLDVPSATDKRRSLLTTL